jgi:hypothetical protein
MTLENPLNKQEKVPEEFPTLEEIEMILGKILPGENHGEPKIKTNEEGVYFYEVEATLESGEKIEYNFQKATYDYRDVTLPKGAQYSASIHATYYDANSMPTGGGCVANYLDGEWKFPGAI